MTVHAMPVMLGVLAVLAIAYRYYSAFLAARVAVLDDSRVTPAHTLNDGQNLPPDEQLGALRPPLRGDLRGRAADRAGAGDPVRLPAGPDLAGGRRLPGRRGAGHARPGRLGPPRRPEPGRDRPRPRSARSPASATAIAILFIIIIALAGLGIVVVKALGGEEVPMKAGHRARLPRRAGDRQAMIEPDGPTVYDVPPGLDLPVRPRPRPVDGLPRAVPRSAVPAGVAARTANPTATGSVLPEEARRLVPGSSWGTFTIACTIPIALFVGLYMYRFRKGKVVEASLIGAVGVLGGDGRRQLDSRLAAGAVLLAHRGTRRSCADRAYGFVASVLPVWLLLCPRDYLSSFLKIGTIALLVVGVIVANPTLQAPPINQHFATAAGRTFDGPHLPVRLHLHHVRRDLRLPRPGLVGHDAEDDRQGDATSA